jgi:hypothetical protein
MDMGAVLVSFYEKAKELGGLKAQMRLAMLTLTPGVKAGDVPDAPDLIKKFEESFKEIEKEFK